MPEGPENDVPVDSLSKDPTVWEDDQAKELLLQWVDVFPAFRSRYRKWENRRWEEHQQQLGEEDSLAPDASATEPQGKKRVSDSLFQNMDKVGKGFVILENNLLPMLAKYVNAKDDARQRLATIKEKHEAHQGALLQLWKEEDSSKREEQTLKIRDVYLPDVTEIIRSLKEDPLPKEV